MNTVIKLIRFVNARPDVEDKALSKALQQDRNQFYELLAVGLIFVPDFDNQLKREITLSNLFTLRFDELIQNPMAFPNEYRVNANRLIVNILKPCFAFDGSLESILSKAVLKRYF